MKYSSLLWQIPLGVLLSLGCAGAVLIGKYGPAFCDRIIAREAEKSRVMLAGQLTDLERDTMGRADKITILTQAQLDATRSESLAAIAAIAEKADRQLTDAVGKADRQITGLRADLTPTLQHVEAISSNLEAITAHADEASALLLRRDALPAQLLGVTAAAKSNARGNCANDENHP